MTSHDKPKGENGAGLSVVNKKSATRLNKTGHSQGHFRESGKEFNWAHQNVEKSRYKFSPPQNKTGHIQGHLIPKEKKMGSHKKKRGSTPRFHTDSSLRLQNNKICKIIFFCNIQLYETS